MRCELTDFEWTAIRPFLPNKPRGVPGVNDRRVLNGIFWILRSGAPWRDLPESFGPYTTCYNRFVSQFGGALLQQDQAMPARRYPV
ncbi:Putative transposase of IS4/5 family [Afipia sp. GAS231]|nr:Putative transposase of IS4/5 family [Afipia sp. GAS231]